MKEKLAFIALALMALLGFQQIYLWAASPTVTCTVKNYDYAKTYSFSYSTNITNVDTAFIYYNSAPFNIQSTGIVGADSMATLELWTSEATADSVRHCIFIQGSSKTPASVTERSITGSAQNWHTIQVDSASLNNSGNSTTPKFVKVPISRAFGRLPYLRIVIAEIGTTAKDANQTIYGRLTIPQYRRPY